MKVNITKSNQAEDYLCIECGDTRCPTVTFHEEGYWDVQLGTVCVSCLAKALTSVMTEFLVSIETARDKQEVLNK